MQPVSGIYLKKLPNLLMKILLISIKKEELNNLRAKMNGVNRKNLKVKDLLILKMKRFKVERVMIGLLVLFILTLLLRLYKKEVNLLQILLLEKQKMKKLKIRKILKKNFLKKLGLKKIEINYEENKTEEEAHLKKTITSVRKIGDGVSLKKSKNRPFLESYLKDRGSKSIPPQSEKHLQTMNKSQILKESILTKQEPEGEKFEVIQIAKNLKYIGNTKNGLFHGEGKILTSEGEIIYEGNFQNGFYSGFGKLKNIRNEYTKILPNEILNKFMSLSNNNYLSINPERGILDVNFSEQNWVNYEGFFSKKGRKMEWEN